MIILDQPSDAPSGKSVEQVLSEGYDFKFGQYISRGIEIFKSAPGIFILGTLIYFASSALSSILPGGSLLFSLCAGPQILAGFYIVAFLIVQKRPFEFSNFFDAFRTHFTHLLILGLILLIITIVVMIPIVIALAGYIVSTIGYNSLDTIDFPFNLLQNVSQGFGLLALLLILPAVYLAVSWILAPKFVLFRSMDAWKALEASRKIVGKRWINFFAFILFVSIAGSVLGLLACGIGLLVTIPVIYLCIFAAFEDIMGFGKAQDAAPSGNDVHSGTGSSL